MPPPPTAAVFASDTELLYRSHHGWLVGCLRRRLGCSETAADLAHDAFIRLLHRPRRFDSFDGTRAYLSTMAHGLCVDFWRRRRVEQAYLEALAARPEAVVPSCEHQALVIETLCEFDEMLGDLPENVAQAFVLSRLHDMPYRYIAARLGVSERMVKKYMARAMVHCALILDRLDHAASGG